MNKDTLITFIEKYNLAGSIESVKLVSDGSVLKTSFASEQKTLAGSVTAKTIQLPAAELSVFQTSRMKGFVKILDGEIDISYNYEDTGEEENADGEDVPVKKLVGVTFKDKVTEVDFVLSDPSVIPPAPKVKEVKSFDVEIPITKEFVGRFIKAKSVLNEVDTFTLKMNEKTGKLELIIGYSSIASNRIKVEVTPTAGKDSVKAPISFDANNLRDILLANQDGLTGAVFKVSEAGIANISFTTDEFDSTYFMIKKTLES